MALHLQQVVGNGPEVGGWDGVGVGVLSYFTKHQVTSFTRVVLACLATSARPPTMSQKMGEWLPKSLGGGSQKPPTVLQSVQVRMNNTMGAARENTSNAAAMAGLSTGSQQDNPCAEMCPNLSFRQRVQGCLGCFALGFVISGLSFISWSTGQTATFAFMYTIGNIVSLAGSMFLMGPKRQCRNMMKARRRWAAGIYLTMMIVTIILALNDGPGLVVLLCVFLQWCAMVWYVASYIPFGQRMITRVLGSTASSLGI
jgi:hypothetical protein